MQSMPLSPEALPLLNEPGSGADIGARPLILRNAET